jgi:hypothetical protein
MKRKLKEMAGFKHYLEAGWDGETAKAVPAEVHDRAQKVMDLLPEIFFNTQLVYFSFMAGLDGSLGLFWYPQSDADHFELYIDVRVSDKWAYFYSDKKKDIKRGMSYDTFKLSAADILKRVGPILPRFNGLARNPVAV